MNMMDKILSVRTPPSDAVTAISGGNLGKAGMSNINPQWRIDAMNSTFGVYGVGWKFEVVSVDTKDLCDGQVFVSAVIDLFVSDYETGAFLPPVRGYGGDKLVKVSGSKLFLNDEAYKSAVTDALGTAMKFYGVGADIYRGLNDGKYGDDKSTPIQDAPQYPKDDRPWIDDDGLKIIAGKLEGLSDSERKDAYQACDKKYKMSKARREKLKLMCGLSA